eukprot:COSAG02_NODE_377_length_23536_cov_12.651065_17_plen_95_part_00
MRIRNRIHPPKSRSVQNRCQEHFLRIQFDEVCSAMTHPDYWNSVPYSAELDSAAKVPTAASTGKQGFGAAILDSELQRSPPLTRPWGRKVHEKN